MRGKGLGETSEKVEDMQKTSGNVGEEKYERKKNEEHILSCSQTKRQSKVEEERKDGRGMRKNV